LLSDKGETIILIVEIISEKRTKPFLGGFRVMPDDIEYHHAGMQTEKVRKRSWSKQFEGKIYWNICPLFYISQWPKTKTKVTKILVVVVLQFKKRRGYAVSSFFELRRQQKHQQIFWLVFLSFVRRVM
jgi:hypothetical protein